MLECYVKYKNLSLLINNELPVSDEYLLGHLASIQV